MCTIKFLFSGPHYFMDGVGGTFRWSTGKTSFFALAKENSVSESKFQTSLTLVRAAWISTSWHWRNSATCVFTFIAIDALSVMSCQLIPFMMIFCKNLQIQIIKSSNTNCKRSETIQNLNAWNMVWCHVVWYHVERYHVVW